MIKKKDIFHTDKDNYPNLIFKAKKEGRVAFHDVYLDCDFEIIYKPKKGKNV